MKNRQAPAFAGSKKTTAAHCFPLHISYRGKCWIVDRRLAPHARGWKDGKHICAMLCISLHVEILSSSSMLVHCQIPNKIWRKLPQGGVLISKFKWRLPALESHPICTLYIDIGLKVAEHGWATSGKAIHLNSRRRVSAQTKTGYVKRVARLRYSCFKEKIWDFAVRALHQRSLQS